jgi:glycerol-3-phosphate dehydrogenase subunit C
MPTKDDSHTHSATEPGLDIRSPVFWDRTEVDMEFGRVFDICHQCRRCFDLCPSFDFMFKRIDAIGEDASALKAPDHKEVVDLCYQCKLCYNHCPYTPPHVWNIDFPRFMLRAKAVEVKERGRVTTQDKALGKTDLIGKLGSALAPLANFANSNKLNRIIMEKVVGIHRDRNLPRFFSETFSRWFRKRNDRQGPAENGKVAMFYTCSVEYNAPEVGKASTEVLEHNNISVACPEQRCCGMPFLDGGDIEATIESAAFNVKHLAEAVRSGADVVVPGPTCSYMIKREYPDLLNTDDARLVAEHTYDICEFLVKKAREKKLDRSFKVGIGKVAYQAPCHLRAQNVGFKSRDLMKAAGADVDLIEQCSAVDGTWGFKKEYYQLSMKVAKPLFDKVEQADPNYTVSDCLMAGMQITQGTGRKVLHPIQIVHKAYGLDEEAK